MLDSVAHAQQSSADNYRQQLDRLRREELLQPPPGMPAEQRALLDYGGYFTFDYLTVDDQNNNSHALRQYDFFGYARLNIDGANEVFLRFRTGYQDFNNGDSFDGRGDEPIDGDLDVGYYKFDLARYMGAYKGREIDGDLTVKVGRDIVYWANGLALAQVIDGGVVEVTKGPVEVSAIAGVTPVRTVDFDASRPDFDFNTRRGFYGAIASAQVGEHRPFIYGLLQQDYNRNEALKQGAITTHFGYDSYYLGLGSTGSLSDKITYGAELVYEGGSGLSNSYVVTPGSPFLTPVKQTRDEINAFAADLRLDYLVMDLSRSRISGELLLATGDDDRQSTSQTFSGNKPGTADNAFNGFGLINTGQSFAAAPSNLIVVRGGVSSYPFSTVQMLKRMQLGVDVFVYSKFSREAPIDEPTADKHYLGWEPDFYMNWPITSDVTLAMRYGIFFPSRRAFSDSENRQFFSTSVTFAF